MPLDENDIEDLGLVTEGELASVAGAGDAYRNDPITSVSSGTVTVAPANGIPIEGFDNPVTAGDRFVLSGATAGDGTYTVLAVTGDFTFTVVEAIVDSTGGTGDFRHPVGASKVGVDSGGLGNSSADNVQDALGDLDGALINPAQHTALRDLIHFIDSGPVGAAFFEKLPNGPFPLTYTWWTNAGKTEKIVELTVTRNAQQRPTAEAWVMYDTDGVTPLVTVTDTIAYSGAFETSRTRVVT